jgi:hypothetical protein
VKNSSLEIMKQIGEKLYIPVRNTKLFAFGEEVTADAAAAAAAAEAAPAKDSLSQLMAEEGQVNNTTCATFRLVFSSVLLDFF